jgi:hypothetical protein
VLICFIACAISAAAGALARHFFASKAIKAERETIASHLESYVDMAEVSIRREAALLAQVVRAKI